MCVDVYIQAYAAKLYIICIITPPDVGRDNVGECVDTFHRKFLDFR